MFALKIQKIELEALRKQNKKIPRMKIPERV